MVCRTQTDMIGKAWLSGASHKLTRRKHNAEPTKQITDSSEVVGLVLFRDVDLIGSVFYRRASTLGWQ